MDLVGIEPTTFRMQSGRSAPELKTPIQKTNSNMVFKLQNR